MKTPRRLYDDFSEATITWTRPIIYERFVKLSEEKQKAGNFYKILVKYSTYNFKVVYIGKIYKQFASHRLLNPDHKLRYKAIKNKHSHSIIFVSLGNIETDKKITSGLIDRIERLLIYTHSNDDFKLINSKGTIHHNLKDGIIIYNKGFKTGMYSEVSNGVYYKI